MKATVLVLSFSILVFGQMNNENTINVEGIGKVTAVPNMTSFSVGATAKNKNYDSTLIKLDQLVNIIFPIFDKYKLQKEDFVVMPMSIGEDREYTDRKWVSNGYKASKEVQVKFKDLAKLSLFARDLITNTGISVSRMQFSHTKLDSIKGIALKRAMDDAKMKAETICQYNKLKLGKPILFSTAKSKYDYDNEDYGGIGYGSGFGGGGDLIGSLMGEDEASDARGSQTLSSVKTSSQLFKIDPGELTIKDKVLVIYQISQEK
ncbi:MAG: SIMPL domain-containing protein [Chitinispirillaceae bacterium]